MAVEEPVGHVKLSVGGREERVTGDEEEKERSEGMRLKF